MIANKFEWNHEQYQYFIEMRDTFYKMREQNNTTMFSGMSVKELRSYIAGCHAARDYDSYFESACKELNSR